MPATLDATKGAATANVYANADEADDFLDSTYGADEWGVISDDDKARLLLTATRSIEALPIAFGKADATQALSFPVKGVPDGSDGFEHAKEACILQAYYLLRNSDAILEGETGMIHGLKGESLGPTSKSITGLNQVRKLSPDVYRHLGKYIDLSMKIYRG